MANKIGEQTSNDVRTTFERRSNVARTSFERRPNDVRRLNVVCSFTCGEPLVWTKDKQALDKVYRLGPKKTDQKRNYCREREFLTPTITPWGNFCDRCSHGHLFVTCFFHCFSQGLIDNSLLTSEKNDFDGIPKLSIKLPISNTNFNLEIFPRTNSPPFYY